MEDELEPGSQHEGDGSPQSSTGSNASGTPADGVESGGSGHEGTRVPPGSGQPNGGRNRFFAAQRYEKKLEQRFGRIEDALGQLLEATKPKETPPSSVPVGSSENFWQDPTGNLEQRLQRERAEIRKLIADEVSQNLNRFTVEQKAQLANQYLATLGDFSEDDLLEMKEIAQELGLDYSKNPQRAAMAVYKMWQESKGINSNAANGNNPKPSKVQAGGPKSGIGPTGIKEWTKEEIASVSGDPEKYEKYRPEIRAALRKRLEGKV